MLVPMQVVEPNIWGTLFTFAGAIGTSAVLGVAKRTDAKIFANPFFRKIQPLITLAGAVAAPYVAHVASSHVDISNFGVAPTATLATVVGAELYALLKRSV